MITLLISLVAIGILIWGFYRARPMGKLGILAWLQSVVLMVPWLLFFGLFSLGIYLNLAGVLVLLIGSTAIYMVLGNQLRSLSQNTVRPNPSSLDTFSPQPSQPSSEATTEDKTSVETEAPKAATQSTAKNSVVTAGEPEIQKIPADDLQAIKGIFGVDTFFATETIPYMDGAIFKGNLRGEAVASHARLSTSLKERLGDRYDLFLVPDQEEKPTIVVLPSSNRPQPTTVSQWIVAGLLAIATLATCLETSGLLQGFDLVANFARLRQTLPIALGIITVLAAHEIGHRVVAARHQVRLSPPFFLPTWQIGSFGAVTRFESLLPDRNVLFDISLAGPAAGGIASLAILLVGLLLSHSGSLFQVPSTFFQGSILVGTLARVVLGDALQQELVDVNPLTIIGWLGLVMTAINLMPAGQLDGGRIVQAIYGRKVAAGTTIGTIIVLGIVSFVNPLALYWALVLLFLQRGLERPALNDLSEPDDARAALGLLALFLMAATLLPLTPGLAGRLGIGG